MSQLLMLPFTCCCLCLAAFCSHMQSHSSSAQMSHGYVTHWIVGHWEDVWVCGAPCDRSVGMKTSCLLCWPSHYMQHELWPGQYELRCVHPYNKCFYRILQFYHSTWVKVRTVLCYQSNIRFTPNTFRNDFKIAWTWASLQEGCWDTDGDSLLLYMVVGQFRRTQVFS